ncbi:hypothetical protein JCM10003_43 [Bacteroides pyogenes JCM 10003]|nr:hypothetical protein JCM10003_43 [Bacteroides pyogenes JCM 10003]
MPVEFLKDRQALLFQKTGVCNDFSRMSDSFLKNTFYRPVKFLLVSGGNKNSSVAYDICLPY